MCQPGRPGVAMPMRRRPRRLAGLRRLPQDEIHRTAFIRRDVDAGAGFHLVETAIGEAAVVRHRGHVKQHMVLGDIRVPPGDEHFAQRHHLADMSGRARLDGRRQHAERGDVLVELRRRLLGELSDRHDWIEIGIPLHRPRVDLVVDVGDVARVGDVLLAVDVAEQPKQHVENDDGPRVADVREVVDRRPADVHAHVAGIDRLERLLAPRQRIVERESHAAPMAKPCHQGWRDGLCARNVWQRNAAAPAVC